jgi:hypothetical protein
MGWLSKVMAVRLFIDSKLVDQAMKVSGERTKKAVVTRALEEVIARRSQKPLLELSGKFEWDPKYDHKTGRSR